MDQPTVVVTGQAQRTVDPDSFAMTARITVRAGDAAAAHSGLVQQFLTLDNAVLALGGDDIVVRRGAVQSWGEAGRQQRWHASRGLTVVCRDPARATEVAGAFGRIADVEVDGPHWFVDRTHPAYADAQTEAVQDARDRAARYALALGGELGRLVELRDAGGGRMEFAMAARAMGRTDELGLDDLDLSPQPQTITVAIETRWYLVLPA